MCKVDTSPSPGLLKHSHRYTEKVPDLSCARRHCISGAGGARIRGSVSESSAGELPDATGTGVGDPWGDPSRRRDIVPGYSAGYRVRK